MQDDFRARLDWCVMPRDRANHAPQVRVAGQTRRTAMPGDVIDLDAAGSTDPDGDALSFAWEPYPEASGTRLRFPIENAAADRAQFTVPATNTPEELHLLLSVTDNGDPPLSRYARVIIDVRPDQK